MEKFWAKVDKTAGENGCWIWTGSKLKTGYGTLGINKMNVLAHRLSYELNVGPIPEGMTIDHKCRNRSCVNPDHLEPVTMYENVMRGNSPSSINARRTHCKNGHPFDDSNTYLRPGKIPGEKKRLCRTCNLEWRRRRWREQHKEKQPKTHCKHGHPLTEDNVYINPSGRRFCKTCTRASGRKYDQKRRKRK